MPEYEHEFPLKDLTKSDCHGIFRKTGIKRPAMYSLGYPNNNCIGCLKGGIDYWNHIRRDFPQVFEKRSKFERFMAINDSATLKAHLEEGDGIDNT